MTRVKTEEIRTRVSYGLSVDFGKLQRFIDSVKSGGRSLLYSAAGSRVEELVRKHLVRTAAPTHHASADRLGANHTGFLEEGARRVTADAGTDHAEVLIPVPGISRAFRDLTVTPKNWDYLTIPADAVSYGRRAAEVRALGFSIFRPAAKGAKLVSKDPRKFSSYKNILMGSRDGEVKKLYSLAESAHLRQDRGLLPSDAEIGESARQGIREYLQRRFAA